MYVYYVTIINVIYIIFMQKEDLQWVHVPNYLIVLKYMYVLSLMLILLTTENMYYDKSLMIRAWYMLPKIDCYL